MNQAVLGGSLVHVILNEKKNRSETKDECMNTNLLENQRDFVTNKYVYILEQPV